MSEVRRWVEAIVLAQYADVFEAKRVGEDRIYHLAGAIEVRTRWLAGKRSYDPRRTSTAHLG
jgi:hypothetical protein